MYKDKKYVVVTLREAEAKRIAEEQEAQRLAAIKPEPFVEKVAAPEPVRATPVHTAAPVARLQSQ